MAFENKGAMTATVVVAASNSLNKNAANYTCPGAADDVKIQEAIDAVAATGWGKGEVKLLEGLYNISSTIHLRPKVSLIGCPGITGSQINLANNSDCDMVDFETTAATGIDGFLQVAHLRLHGNKANQASGHGVHMWGTHQVNDIVIHDCYIAHIKEKGIYYEQVAWGPKIYDCPIEYTDGIGIDIGQGSQIYIAHCFLEYNDYGIKLYAADCVITGCQIVGATHAAIYLYYGSDIIIQGCRALVCGSNVNWVYDSAFSMTNGTRVVVQGCIVEDDGTHSWTGIRLESCTYGTVGNCVVDHTAREGINVVSTVNSTVQNNVVNNCPTPIMICAGNNLAYKWFHDTFEDVLPCSANYIVNAQALVNGAVALTGTQPKYPRGLVFAITEGAPGDVTDYTMTVLGINGQGQGVTEVFTFAVDGLAFSSGNAFDHVTSVTLADVVDAGAAATLDVGIDGRLGLMNVIYETGDVWKITKNLAKQVVAGADVDTDYDTYDMAAAIGIAVNDDFVIWYRSHLNVIS